MRDLSKPRQEPRMDAVSAISPSRCCVRLGPLPVMSCPHLRSQPPFSDFFSVCRVRYDYGNFLCLIPTMILLAPRVLSTRAGPLPHIDVPGSVTHRGSFTSAARKMVMSAPSDTTSRRKRRGIADLVKGGTPIVGLTAYTAHIATLLDPHVDFLLVGDSLGMVVYGFDTTVPVTTEMMIAHGGAVVRATSQALIVVDLPFGSYQESREQAFRTAARILAEAGCGAVKLDGGTELTD